MRIPLALPSLPLPKFDKTTSKWYSGGGGDGDERRGEGEGREKERDAEEVEQDGGKRRLVVPYIFPPSSFLSDYLIQPK